MSDPLQIDEEAGAFSSSPAYYEWTDGVAYAISNTPSSYHQIIQDELTQQLKMYFSRKRCRVYPAPFTVNLTEFVKSKKRPSIFPTSPSYAIPLPIDSFEGLQLEIRDDWFWFERGNLKPPR